MKRCGLHIRVSTDRQAKERVSKITEILAEGVLALLRSLPFALAVSRVKVSESVKVQVVAADDCSC